MMFQSFADLKRAAQKDILLTIGKGNPESEKKKQSEPTKKQRRQRGTSSPKYTENALSLNVEAKEFYPYSTSESSETSLSPSYCNGMKSKTEETDISILQSSLQKLNLNDSLTSTIENSDTFSEKCITRREKSFGNNNHLQEQKAKDSFQNHGLSSESFQVNNTSSFMENHASLFEAASQDPSSLKAKDFIFISDLIIAKALENRDWSGSLASLSMKILAVEQRQLFAQIHLNKLKYAVEEVFGSEKANPHSFSPFIDFLYNFFSEAKEKKRQLANLLPDMEYPLHLILIKLLVHTCLHLLHQKELKFINDIELLMFVMSAVNLDLEMNFPELKIELIASVRDAFLSSRASAQVRIFLLELVEMAASKWRLPVRTIHFYQKYLLKG